MLDASPVLWAVNLPELFDREAVSVFNHVLVGDAAPPVVFYHDIRHAWGNPDMEVPPIREMLRQFAGRPDLRTKVPSAANHGVQLDALFKANSAAVRDPEQPILSRLHDMHLNRTASGLVLPTPYPEKELLARAGGLVAFPAYNVLQALGKTRLKDKKFATKPNDLLDEWHACYSPYAHVTALDRATVARCHTAKLPHITCITASLADVPQLVSERGRGGAV